MGREELTCTTRAGRCRGRSRADEHTCGDQSPDERRKSLVLHGTPFEVGRSWRVAGRFANPSSRTAVALFPPRFLQPRIALVGCSNVLGLTRSAQAAERARAPQLVGLEPSS